MYILNRSLVNETLCRKFHSKHFVPCNYVFIFSIKFRILTFLSYLLLLKSFSVIAGELYFVRNLSVTFYKTFLYPCHCEGCFLLRRYANPLFRQSIVEGFFAKSASASHPILSVLSVSLAVSCVVFLSIYHTLVIYLSSNMKDFSSLSCQRLMFAVLTVSFFFCSHQNIC